MPWLYLAAGVGLAVLFALSPTWSALCGISVAVLALAPFCPEGR